VLIQHASSLHSSIVKPERHAGIFLEVPCVQ
jgi:hypothetical protein